MKLRNKTVKNVDNELYKAFVKKCEEKGWRVLPLARQVFEAGLKDVVEGKKEQKDYEENTKL